MVRVVDVLVSHGVQPSPLLGPEVGLIVQQSPGVGPTLGCCLRQQVLRDAGQQLLHMLCCTACLVSTWPGGSTCKAQAVLCDR